VSRFKTTIAEGDRSRVRWPWSCKRTRDALGMPTQKPFHSDRNLHNTDRESRTRSRTLRGAASGGYDDAGVGARAIRFGATAGRQAEPGLPFLPGRRAHGTGGRRPCDRGPGGVHPVRRPARQRLWWRDPGAGIEPNRRTTSPGPRRRKREHAHAAVPRWSRPGAGRQAEPVSPFHGVTPAARRACDRGAESDHPRGGAARTHGLHEAATCLSIRSGSTSVGAGSTCD